MENFLASDDRKPVPAEQVALDIQSGRETRNLSRAIQEIDEARKMMSASDYRKFITDLNDELDENDILEDITIDVVGVDGTGKNLVVTNRLTRQGRVLNEYGKQLGVLSSDELKAFYPGEQHLSDVSAGKAYNGQFSLFMPPGVDNSGKGALASTSRRVETSTDPKTGYTTTRVSGELDDADSAINIHGYRSIGRTKYTGSYVTTGDGKILEGHAKYTFGKEKEVGTLTLFQYDKYPEIKKGPTFVIKEFGGDPTRVRSVDIKYDALTDSYVGQLANPGFSYSFILKNGKAKVVGEANVGGLSVLAGAFQLPATAVEGGPKYDSSGFLVGTENMTIERDKSHEITKVKTTNAGTWTRTGPKQWLHEVNGKTERESGDLFVDANDALVLQKQRSARIFLDETKFDLNDRGLVTKREKPGLTHEYSYNSDNRMIFMRETLQTEPASYNDYIMRSITEKRFNDESPHFVPLRFF